MTQCDHWSECGITSGGCCAAGHFGGSPSLGVCRQCPHRQVNGAVIDAEKSKLEMAKDYARAELTHATQGPASEADAAARLAICMECEHRATDYKGQTDPVGWCQRCGCGSNPRAVLTIKVTLAGASCPLTPPKWDAVQGTGATLASAVDAVAGVTKSIIHKLTGG